MAEIFKTRKENANKVTCNIPLNNSDPALLTPTCNKASTTFEGTFPCKEEEIKNI